MNEREKFEAWAGQFVSKGLIEDMTWEYKAWLAAKEECRKSIPEGCAPADAEKLREFNHSLETENAKLKAGIACYCREELGNMNFESDNEAVEYIASFSDDEKFLDDVSGDALASAGF